jgi:hypothetical protein
MMVVVDLDGGGPSRMLDVRAAAAAIVVVVMACVLQPEACVFLLVGSTPLCTGF